MAGRTFGEEKEAIFEGHIMLLEDEELEGISSLHQRTQSLCRQEPFIEVIEQYAQDDGRSG